MSLDRPTMRRGRRGAWSLVAVALMSLVAGGSTATAAATLDVPVEEETIRSLGTTALVEGNAKGDTAAAWRVTENGATTLKAAVRPVGGDWSTPVDIAAFPTPDGPTGLEPQLEGLGVGPDGRPWILWQPAERDALVPSKLELSTIDSDGTARVDGTVAVAPLGRRSALRVTRGGDVTVLWSTATSRPVEFDEEEVKAGMAMVSTRTAAGTWEPAVSLGPSNGIDAEPQLGGDAAGNLAALWSPAGDPYEPGPSGWARRNVGGGWSAGPVAVGISGRSYSGVGPLIDPAGRMHTFGYQSGNYGIAGLSHQTVAAGQSTRARIGDVREGSVAQTIRGWIGGGYVEAAGAAVDASGQPVVITARAANDVESGNFGTGGLFAATLAPAGTWSVVRIDPLGETANAVAVDVSSDAAGNVVATWADDARGSECGSVVYRSVRAPNGVWSPRQVAAVAGARTKRSAFDGSETDVRPGPCLPVVAASTDGPAPMLSWQGAGRLTVTPSADVANPPVAAAPAATLVTTRWRDVRRAGGVVVKCATPSDGFCSLSQVRAIYDAGRNAIRKPKSERAKNLIRALRCLQLRSTTPVTTAAPEAKLERGPGCNRGWEPPTASFTLLVTLDAVGQTPSSQRIKVTIRR